jgi:saccharopine dehydrogenase-like NADP-dependent oxidoreductase
MAPKTILLLGASGNTGRILAELLLQYSDTRLKVASRSAQKAAGLAVELNRRFPGERVRPAVVEAGSLESLRKALSGVDLLAAASSTSAFTETAVRACLQAGVDYFDVQFSASKIKVLRLREAEIRQAGRFFLTEGGFHPGLPAALVRWGAARFDSLHKANVGSVIKIDWRGLQFAPETAAEMVREFSDFNSLFFKDGRWRKGRMDIVVDYVRMDFGAPFGRQLAVPMFLEELRGLPEAIPSLRDVGFFVGSFNWFTDWFMLPLGMLWARVASLSAERTFAGWLLWSLKAFSRPPYGTRLKLEAEGLKDGQSHALELLLSHPDGYFFTAAPAAAALLQWLDGSGRRPGLFTQGEWVEPVRLLADLERMGISISQTWK